jgi:hypothetical protein
MEGEFAVFLIGMRINKLWKPHKWLPAFLAMPKLLKEIEPIQLAGPHSRLYDDGDSPSEK